ncbi:ATP-binding cassette domain-containing protein [Streptomyces decoyicus]|uniref:ATP-binding cassette domain-containing protein n=1 Tax=Streptomyces decoyicus TaxID=249567 RepID=UPI00386E709E|nr:ATP-binding cassette domain-containing protein [Streptomyces decoyicus]
MTDRDHAIVVEELHKHYGTKAALDGLDLTVPHGVVHGVLGPNGAGKTTLVRILSTLLRHDGGRAEVAGFDVLRKPDEVRLRIGLLGQHAAVDEELSGWQNLEMFGRLFHLGARRAGERADELLGRFGLAGTGRKAVRHYSGGMRRRLDLAASLVMAPQILFLDEPTTGLDPRGRTEVWQAVRSLVDGGTTVLLTTQYLEEADQLADRISVVDGGRVVADGTPDELKSATGGDRIDVVLHDAGQLGRAAGLLGEALGSAAGGGAVAADAEGRRLSVPVADRMAGLAEAVRVLAAAGIEAADLAVRRPTLDEVFLHLTGDGAAGGAAGARPSAAAAVYADKGGTTV